MREGRKAGTQGLWFDDQQQWWFRVVSRRKANKHIGTNEEQKDGDGENQSIDRPVGKWSNWWRYGKMYNYLRVLCGGSNHTDDGPLGRFVNHDLYCSARVANETAWRRASTLIWLRPAPKNWTLTNCNKCNILLSLAFNSCRSEWMGNLSITSRLINLNRIGPAKQNVVTLYVRLSWRGKWTGCP